MTRVGSVEGDATVRLFFGLPLPSEVASAFTRWQTEVYRGVDEVRPVPAENLHVTLAFLGRRPAAEASTLRAVLHETAAGADRPVLTPSRYRETQQVAMVVLTDQADGAGAFQRRLSDALEQLGLFRPERRAWLPHVTVARLRARPRLRPAVPTTGPFSPSDAALYHSVLRPDGAQYSIVEAVALGG